MRAKRVEVGVLDRCTPPLWLPAVGRMGWGDGVHGGGLLRLEVVLVVLALGRPDGSKQTGHGREAAGPREVWLQRTGTTVRLAVRLLSLSLRRWFLLSESAVCQC